MLTPVRVAEAQYTHLARDRSVDAHSPVREMDQ